MTGPETVARPEGGNTTATGRPLRADARRNRDRVLEAARVAFAAEGASVPLDEIARRAGVGAGTVYRHFPTKEALFEAVVHDRFRQLTEDGRALSADADPGEALLRFIERLVTEAALKRYMIDALNGAGVDITAALAGVVGELRAETGRLLASAQQAGAVRDDIDISDLMALLSGMIQATQPRPGRSIEPRRAIAVLCDGLRAPAFLAGPAVG
jgi:AcrR family transcriptional regulator